MEKNDGAKTEIPRPPTVEEVLRRSISYEVDELTAVAEECRKAGDRAALIAAIEARSRIKLDTAAMAFRVEANLRRMVGNVSGSFEGAQLPDRAIQAAAAARALDRLRGPSRRIIENPEPAADDDPRGDPTVELKGLSREEDSAT